MRPGLRAGPRPHVLLHFLPLVAELKNRLDEAFVLVLLPAARVEVTFFLDEVSLLERFEFVVSVVLSNVGAILWENILAETC